ncbi:MAG: hypothetical protein GXO90_01700 [FCB group bacterium]|nr:hypothetical protein [FCB group bacterium]
MKIVHLGTFLTILFFCSCVGPEEPLDGLIENLPAVVSTKTAFTYSLKANDYSFNDTYVIDLKAQPSNELVLTLAVNNVGSRLDTTELSLVHTENDSLLYHYFLMTNQVQTSIITIDSSKSGLPTRFDIRGKHYTGQIDFILALQ